MSQQKQVPPSFPNQETCRPAGLAEPPAALRGAAAPLPPCCSNTKKSRGWCFTYNNYTVDTVRDLRTMECKYIIFGKETAPETGTPHLQGYVLFNNQTYFRSVKKMIGDHAHIEAAKGNPWQNREYCSKTGDFEEYGETPKNSTETAKNNRARYDKAVALAKEGKLDEIDSDLLTRHLGNFSKMAMLHKRSFDMKDWGDEDMQQHYFWIYGATGSGKSHLARAMSTRICETTPPFLKQWNKWWDGYTGDDVPVILDEATPKNCEHLAGYIKQWVDKWTFRPEIKGSHLSDIRPKWIIVTSNYSIEECFPNEQDHTALHRRFRTIRLDTRDDSLLDQLLPKNQNSNSGSGSLPGVILAPEVSQQKNSGELGIDLSDLPTRPCTPNPELDSDVEDPTDIDIMSTDEPLTAIQAMSVAFPPYKKRRLE